MYCIQCNHPLKDTDILCPNCGTAVYMTIKSEEMPKDADLKHEGINAQNNASKTTVSNAQPQETQEANDAISAEAWASQADVMLPSSNHATADSPLQEASYTDQPPEHALPSESKPKPKALLVAGIITVFAVFSMVLFSQLRTATPNAQTLVSNTHSPILESPNISDVASGSIGLSIKEFTERFDFRMELNNYPLLSEVHYDEIEYHDLLVREYKLVTGLRFYTVSDDQDNIFQLTYFANTYLLSDLDYGLYRYLNIYIPYLLEPFHSEELADILDTTPNSDHARKYTSDIRSYTFSGGSGILQLNVFVDSEILPADNIIKLFDKSLSDECTVQEFLEKMDDAYNSSLATYPSIMARNPQNTTNPEVGYLRNFNTAHYDLRHKTRLYIRDTNGIAKEIMIIAKKESGDIYDKSFFMYSIANTIFFFEEEDSALSILKTLQIDSTRDSDLRTYDSDAMLYQYSISEDEICFVATFKSELSSYIPDQSDADPDLDPADEGEVEGNAETLLPSSQASQPSSSSAPNRPAIALLSSGLYGDIDSNRNGVDPRTDFRITDEFVWVRASFDATGVDVDFLWQFPNGGSQRIEKYTYSNDFVFDGYSCSFMGSGTGSVSIIVGGVTLATHTFTIS